MTTQATILASEVHMMESKHTGKTYRITVSLPWGYAASPDETWPFNNMPEQWPAVYVPDGNWYAGMVTDMIRPVSLCGGISSAIVIGIGYPEDENPVEAFRDFFTRRNYDLTPVQDEDEEKAMEAGFKRPAPTGGASKFLLFLKEELIPFIEKTYRANPEKRIFAGHSYGGLFAAYAMFESPELFQTLIIGSPTLSQGDRYVFNQEEAFSQANKKLAAKVLIYAGDEESLNDSTLTDTLRFAAMLEGRRHEGLSVTKQVFLDYNHCEVIVPGFFWGLKQALKR